MKYHETDNFIPPAKGLRLLQRVWSHPSFLHEDEDYVGSAVIDDADLFVVSRRQAASVRRRFLYDETGRRRVDVHVVGVGVDGGRHSRRFRRRRRGGRIRTVGGGLHLHPYTYFVDGGDDDNRCGGAFRRSSRRSSHSPSSHLSSVHPAAAAFHGRLSTAFHLQSQRRRPIFLRSPFLRLAVSAAATTTSTAASSSAARRRLSPVSAGRRPATRLSSLHVPREWTRRPLSSSSSSRLRSAAPSRRRGRLPSSAAARLSAAARVGGRVSPRRHESTLSSAGGSRR